MTYTEIHQIVKKEFERKTDKGGEPYFYHLIRVASKFHETQDKKVAMLHDIIEDCPGWNYERVLEIAGKTVADAVMALTKYGLESYDEYLFRVASNDIAIRVKIADLEDNMNVARLKELTEKDIERLKKYHKAYLFLKSKIQQNDTTN